MGFHPHLRLSDQSGKVGSHSCRQYTRTEPVSQPVYSSAGLPEGLAMASPDPRVELTCSVCVEIFKDPVTLPCGHSFCQGCITRTWDSQEKDESACPECQRRYRKRPELRRSIRLANLVECFSPSKPEQPENGIFCGQCIQIPVPAVKSCLHCEVSLCDNHLRFHRKSPEHVLCDPAASLGNRKCSVHRKILEYYCAQDSTLICASCRLDGDHQGHPVKALREVSENKKDQLRKDMKDMYVKRRKMEERVQQVRERRHRAQERVDGVTGGVMALFRDIRTQLEDLERRILTEISRHHEVILSFSDLIQQLELKKDKLSRRIQRMEELCGVHDPLTVIMGEDVDGEDFCDPDEGDEDLYSGDLDEGLISEMVHTGLSDLMSGVMRGIYVQGPAEVLLDVSTAARNVRISHDLKTISLPCEEDPADGSQDCGLVFSSRSFSSGRHYWEVETSELGDCDFGVAYPSMERTSSLGSDGKSWCMCKWNVNTSNRYLVAHDNAFIDIDQGVSCNRFGVYLDCEAGRLSFYELSIPIRHLHTFSTTFTVPLHAGFSVSNNGDLSPVWITIRN
ncbi:PREDICTED: E3 ubiquitin-protein ligase Midline-1-like [Nanorana parkeri]|uniref:E3 ubiquitin-protein ligase Midline-1-like n=1 Tax=Nanorana parkeri TaxID=125878 RepID=UPI000854B000|nr:PREDICTED: E3 ubiquitin-protein ligase Midline-1-like [Nanorana parkeri]